MDTNPEWLNQWHKILVRTVPLVLFVIGRHFWKIIVFMCFVGGVTFVFENFLSSHFDCYSHLTFLAVPRNFDGNVDFTPNQEKQWISFVAELAQSATPATPAAATPAPLANTQLPGRLSMRR